MWIIAKFSLIMTEVGLTMVVSVTLSSECTIALTSIICAPMVINAVRVVLTFFTCIFFDKLTMTLRGA